MPFNHNDPNEEWHDLNDGRPSEGPFDIAGYIERQNKSANRASSSKLTNGGGNGHTNPQEFLAAHNILLPDTKPGRHYATCPQCSAKRKTAAHRKHKCLGVTIDDQGVRWGCNHCGWTGPSKGANSRSNGGDYQPAATYDYHDNTGKLCFQKLRNPPGSETRFWMRQPDGNGGWIKNTKGVDTNIIYRLPEVLEAIELGREIAVVEGEKDADNLWAIGIPATCNAHGAAEPDKKPKWYAVHSEQLRSAPLVIFNDNDAAGHAHADAAARLSLGIAARVRRLDLKPHWPEMPEGADVSDWLALGHGRQELDALMAGALEVSERNEQESTSSFDSNVETLRSEGDSDCETIEPPVNAQLPLPLNLAQWDDKKLPNREWVVENRILAGNVTLLSADGSTGKSTIALQLGASLVLKRTDWLGALINKSGEVMIVSAEDEEGELVRRLANILKAYRAKFADLDSRFHAYDLSDREATMANFDRDGNLRATQLLTQLEKRACEIRPALIVLDASANVFGGDEINRVHVRKFIDRLRILAKKTGAGILLLAHPSLTGMSSGSGLSGSTAWHNSVRGRMYFSKIRPAGKTADDDVGDDGLRQLVVMKNNYGPENERVRLRYKDGLFVLAQGSSIEEAAAQAKIDEIFLQCLDMIAAQGRHASDHPNSRTYAPNMFAKMPEAKGCTKAGLEAAMERLLSARRIKVSKDGGSGRVVRADARSGDAP
jgi:RecA-family ATPase